MDTPTLRIKVGTAVEVRGVPFADNAWHLATVCAIAANGRFMAGAEDGPLVMRGDGVPGEWRSLEGH